MSKRIIIAVKGGAGSGNWGHTGRPGLIGGSGGVAGKLGPIHTGYDYVPGDLLSVKRAMERGGWKVLSDEPSGVWTKFTNVDDSRAVQLRVVHDSVCLKVSPIRSGKVDSQDYEMVTHIGSTKVPAKVDVVSWVRVGVWNKPPEEHP